MINQKPKEAYCHLVFISPQHVHIYYLWLYQCTWLLHVLHHLKISYLFLLCTVPHIRMICPKNQFFHPMFFFFQSLPRTTNGGEILEAVTNSNTFDIIVPPYNIVFIVVIVLTSSSSTISYHFMSLSDFFDLSFNVTNQCIFH